MTACALLFSVAFSLVPSFDLHRLGCAPALRAASGFMRPHNHLRQRHRVLILLFTLNAGFQNYAHLPWSVEAHSVSGAEDEDDDDDDGAGKYAVVADSSLPPSAAAAVASSAALAAGMQPTASYERDMLDQLVGAANDYEQGADDTHMLLMNGAQVGLTAF
jgi:hypothetical protein